MKKSEQAVALKRTNNCCQAVLLAYADELRLSEAELKQWGAPFGLGMGCMEATCGALCGAQMVLGAKGGTVREAKTLLQGFRAKAGATKCGDLKGIGTGKMRCSCDNCVKYAVECLEEQLGR